MDLSLYQTINNVIYLTEEQDNSSSLYIKVRKKENRILTDDDVKILPYLKLIEKDPRGWKLNKIRSKYFIN